MTTYIYALVDPRTNQCRYIGKANNPSQRLQRHLHPCRLADPTYKNTWLRTVVAQGLVPDLWVVEEVPAAGWAEAERFWIGYLTTIGCNLTNGTAGGDGASFPGDKNPMYGRIGASHPAFGKTRPTEVTARIAATQRGVPHKVSPEGRKRMQTSARRGVGEKNGFYGREHSAETKHAWSEKRKGTMPPNAKLHTLRGRTLYLSEWAKISDIAYGTIVARLRYGWSTEAAIFTPILKTKGVRTKRVWKTKKRKDQQEQGRMQDVLLDLVKDKK